MKIRKGNRNSKGVRALLISFSAKCEDGALVKLEHRAASLERDEAVREAMRAAEQNGLKPWVLLDVIELYDGKTLIG